MSWNTPLLNEGYDPEWRNRFISPVPPHLTPEEREEWKKELEWQQQEIARRKEEGFYKYGD